MPCFIILVLFLSVTPWQSHATDKPIRQRILHLNSYYQDYAWSNSIIQGIKQSFSPVKNDINLYIEYMDTKHHSSPVYYEKLRSLYAYKYKDLHFDLILASDDNALNFLIKYKEKLFPGSQVIFCGVNNPDKARIANDLGMIGIIEDWSAKENIDLILQLFPQTRHLAILADKTTTGEAGKARIYRLEATYRNRLQFIDIQPSSVQETRRAVSNLPPDTVLLYTVFFKTDDGQWLTIKQANDILVKNTNVPIFVISDFNVLPGVIGGVVVSGYHQGVAAADLAKKILFSDPSKSTAIKNHILKTSLFDYSGLKRFGITPSDLPKGSIILNTPVSFYATYKTWIWLTLVCILLETGLIILLIISRLYRKRAEAEQQRLVAALEQSDESFAITDTNGNILYVNPAFETFYTVDHKDILQTPLKNIAPVFRQEKIWAYLQENKIWRKKIEYTFENGTVSDLEFRTSVIKDAQGTRLSYIFTHRDVTREVTLENQLRQAQKMEAIGQLAGGIAHDFNNLLQVILGYTSKILKEGKLDPDTSTRMEYISNASNRAAALVRQLLIFSRRDRATTELVDLNELIEDVLRLLKRTLGEQIHLTFNPGSAPSFISADSGQIHQILMNLCVNARDAMPQGGSIAISTEPVYLDQDFVKVHPWAHEGNFVCITIKDSGMGMSPEIQEHMFEPFFTTKETGKGTGIGLATVYGIVKNHAGMIHVDSTENKGTTFYVYLPLTTEVEPLESPLPKQQPTGHEPVTATLLVAEDDEMVRSLTREVLEDAGYTIIAAADGDEAISMFHAYHTQLDMVMLDVIMPGKNGQQVWEEVSKIRPDLPVLFSSGYSFNELKDNALLSENGQLIQKPYTPGDLLETIADILEKHRAT